MQLVNEGLEPEAKAVFSKDLSTVGQLGFRGRSDYTEPSFREKSIWPREEQGPFASGLKGMKDWKAGSSIPGGDYFFSFL